MELYLSSYEYEMFKKPIRISEYHKLRIGNRELLKLKLYEPTILISYRYEEFYVEYLYVTPRFSLNIPHPLFGFELGYYVLMLKEGITEPNDIDDFENLAWATLYNNFEDAKNHIFQIPGKWRR